MCVKRGLKLTANTFESHSGLIHPNVERVRCSNIGFWDFPSNFQITVIFFRRRRPMPKGLECSLETLNKIFKGEQYGRGSSSFWPLKDATLKWTRQGFLILFLEVTLKDTLTAKNGVVPPWSYSVKPKSVTDVLSGGREGRCLNSKTVSLTQRKQIALTTRPPHVRLVIDSKFMAT